MNNIKLLIYVSMQLNHSINILDTILNTAEESNIRFTIKSMRDQNTISIPPRH